MVSIRKVKKLLSRNGKQVQHTALEEFQTRVIMLIEALTTLTEFNSNKRGDRTRITIEDVKLAYLAMSDEKEEEDFGDWNV
tara:strand:- start:280 stop:522 length:243 start_codon:yes stop_codon:yes gene_type:complete